MGNTLNNSIKRKLTFIIKNNSSNAKMLCLLPAFYSVVRIAALTTDSSATYKPIFDDPSNIVAAGYSCDQVADEDQGNDAYRRGGAAAVLISGSGCNYRDFLEAVRLCGMQISNIRIKNLRESNAGEELFQQQIKIGQAVIGEQSGLRSLNLSSFIKASNYDRSFVDVNMEEANLLCDKETLLFMGIPAGANFSMEFTVED